jgi:hypothetical protein
MVDRRAFLGGAAWVTPTILVAQPTRASVSVPMGVLSPPPGEVLPALPSSVSAKQPLAFTGDDLEREIWWAADLIAAGWILRYWAARSK